MPPDQTFPGGLAALRAQTARGRAQYVGWELILPDHDIDFAEWKVEPTAPVVADGFKSGHALVKAKQLSAVMAHAPMLHFLHAFVISCCRRTPVPDPISTMFHRLWREEGDWLLDTLSYRWLISAVATFRDIGETSADRSAGMALAVLLNSLKLTDSERIISGHHPSALAPKDTSVKSKLALDQDVFALRKGDLDQNLMLYVWEACDAAGPSLRPLALRLMEDLNSDPRTVFRRLAGLRANVSR